MFTSVSAVIFYNVSCVQTHSHTNDISYLIGTQQIQKSFLDFDRILIKEMRTFVTAQFMLGLGFAHISSQHQ